MAEGWGSAAANTALDNLVTTYPWIQLHTSAPGAAGTTAVAVETDRMQGTFAAAAAGSVATNADLQWTAVAGSEDYTHFTAWSASTAGTFGWSGTVTANAVSSGDTFTIPSGQLSASLTLAS